MSDEVRIDTLTAGLAARFAATLDRPPRGDVAPQGIHWCLCLPDAATAALGADGHPAPADALPPRRMWAASEVAFHAPLRIGAAIERRSRVVDRAEKRGASGPLLFVTIEHVTTADGVPAVSETQTIVYRAAVAAPAPPSRPATGTAPAPAAEDGAWRRSIVPSSPLLFRYSALTFNTHRIHYDLPYAREVEGYPGLVVHGPLLATLLLDLADRALGPNRLSRFAFRAERPAFADEPVTLVGERDGAALTLAARAADGTVLTGATATIG